MTSVDSPRSAEPTNFGLAEVVAWRFDDAAVEFAIDISNRTHVLPQVRVWREEERERLGRHAGGAPERFPTSAVWVAMILAAQHNRPMLATTFRDILFRHISPAMRARLGVSDPPAPNDRLAWDALHRCVRTRFHGLLEPIDPSSLPKDRRLAPDEFDAAVEEHSSAHALTPDVLDARHERLTWFVNAVIEASLSLLNRETRRHWRGSVGLDATPVPAFARPERRAPGKKPRARRPVITHSADPDASLYVRTDDAHDNADVTAAGGKRLRPGSGFWAYEATLVVSGNDDPTTDQPFPCLVVGMAPLHRPGTAVGRNATIALSSVAGRGHPTGWLAADRAYTNTIPEDFQLPARALGYDVVLDYRIDQLGVQGSYNGALMIEGSWYCPMMPDALKDATIDFREGRIDEATWQARIEARRPFRTRPKAKPDEEGHVRNLCPASDTAYTGRCELKPRSIERTTSATTRIPVTEELRANPAPICDQQSVTFPPEAGAKLAQTLHYGSAEWASTYHTLRNTIEGINGVAKDGAYAALGDASRRRIRGIAAQSIFTALLLMATNLKTIASFLDRAVPDAAGILRRPRKRRRTTTPIAEWTPPVAERAGAPPP